MKSKKNFIGQAVLNIIFILICCTYILPFVLLISISFSSESAVREFGYTLLPKAFSTEAYKYVFQNPTQIIDSYRTTIIFTIVSTFFMVAVTTLMAYPLSRSYFRYKKILTWYIFITMLFGGGLVPTYIINSKILHLDNTIWIYILPGLVSAWNVIIARTFFQGIPESLVEAAKIDGSSELGVYFKIMLPLSTPLMASIGFMFLVGKWNDWNTALIYIRDARLFSLQYMLQKILREADFVQQMTESNSSFSDYEIPTETVRYATAMLASGPVLVIFPFFQKYFSKGMTIGAVKG